METNKEQRRGEGKLWEEKRGAYNFLQSSKWGPFWQRAVEKPQNGATLESGKGGEGAGEQRTRRQERGEKKRAKEEGADGRF